MKTGTEEKPLLRSSVDSNASTQTKRMEESITLDNPWQTFACHWHWVHSHAQSNTVFPVTRWCDCCGNHDISEEGRSLSGTWPLRCLILFVTWAAQTIVGNNNQHGLRSRICEREVQQTRTHVWSSPDFRARALSAPFIISSQYASLLKLW